ncbi:MAG: hypothetical protein QOI61_609 [Actinomycetota bacterium]|jgi:glucose/arabinose dehydrogenase
MRLRVAVAAIVLATCGFALIQPAQAADAVRASKVITLNEPIALALRTGEPNAVYIAQKAGVIRRLTLKPGGGVTLNPTVVLDINELVEDEGEQGLLGIAFSPDGSKLYAYWTNLAGDNGVYEYPYAAGVANKAAQRLVIPFSHPGHTNHNGGNIIFGTDGMLYIATGDGGDGGAQAQMLGSPLGKILRINPAGAGNGDYTIPASNPFVGTSGARGEIWHLGLRNPWRWSFDRSNGNMWIGDVGQNMYEEVDMVLSTKQAANFGWNRREGFHPRDGGTRPPGNVDPVYEYTHANGNCAITGGYVYRGAKIAGLQGSYLFADYCKGIVKKRTGTTVTNLGVSIPSPISFGQDTSGELWVLSQGGGVYRLVRRV